MAVAAVAAGLLVAAAPPMALLLTLAWALLLLVPLAVLLPTPRPDGEEPAKNVRPVLQRPGSRPGPSEGA